MKIRKRYIIIILAGLALIGYSTVSFLIVAGVTRAERRPLEDSLSNYGVSFEQVAFQSRHNELTLQGWYVAREENMPVIIFVHGIGVNRTARGMTKLAALLHQRGFGALLFDLRAHGQSEGEMISGGWFERLDIMGAYDYLQNRGVPPHNIGLLGFSMGAATSSLAAIEMETRALVMDSSYTSVLELVAQETARKTPFPEWLTPIFIPGARLLANLYFEIPIGQLAPVEAITQLAYPVLLIHGEADTRVPLEHGRRIYAVAPTGSELWIVADVGHVEAFQSRDTEYVDRVERYFRAQLGP